MRPAEKCPGIPEPSCCPRCSGEPGWRRCAEGHESRLRQSARFKNRWSICGMLSGEVRPPAGTGELQGPAPGLFPPLLQNLDGVLCRRQGAGLPLAASCRAAYSTFRPLSRRFRRYGAGPCGILPFPAGRNLHIPGVSPLPLSHPDAPSASPDHSPKTRGARLRGLLRAIRSRNFVPPESAHHIGAVPVFRARRYGIL